MDTIQSRAVGFDILVQLHFSLLQKVLHIQGTISPSEKKYILLHTLDDICHKGQMEQGMERSSDYEEF